VDRGEYRTGAGKGGTYIANRRTDGRTDDRRHKHGAYVFPTASLNALRRASPADFHPSRAPRVPVGRFPRRDILTPRPIRKYSRGVICRGRRCPIGRHRFSRRRAPHPRGAPPSRAGGPTPLRRHRHDDDDNGGGSVVLSRSVRYHIPYSARVSPSPSLVRKPLAISADHDRAARTENGPSPSGRLPCTRYRDVTGRRYERAQPYYSANKWPARASPRSRRSAIIDRTDRPLCWTSKRRITWAEMARSPTCRWFSPVRRFRLPPPPPSPTIPRKPRVCPPHYGTATPRAVRQFARFTFPNPPPSSSFSPKTLSENKPRDRKRTVIT